MLPKAGSLVCPKPNAGFASPEVAGEGLPKALAPSFDFTGSVAAVAGFEAGSRDAALSAGAVVMSAGLTIPA